MQDFINDPLSYHTNNFLLLDKGIRKDIEKPPQNLDLMETITLYFIFLFIPFLIVAEIIVIGIKLEIMWENRDKGEETDLREFKFF